MFDEELAGGEGREKGSIDLGGRSGEENGSNVIPFPSVPVKDVVKAGADLIGVIRAEGEAGNRLEIGRIA